MGRGRDDGFLSRLSRLFRRGDASDVQPESTGTLFTASSLGTTISPPPREDPEPLFDDAPASPERERERDLWDDEPPFGPPPVDTRSAPADSQPAPTEPDEELFADRRREPPSENRLFDDRPDRVATSTEDAEHLPHDVAVAHEDDDLEPSVSELTDQLSRIADDVDDEVLRELDTPTDASAQDPHLEVDPPVATLPIERASDTLTGPYVNVHDERIDRRPGPIRMTPSEALALAKEGPAALRRRNKPN